MDAWVGWGRRLIRPHTRERESERERRARTRARPRRRSRRGAYGGDHRTMKWGWVSDGGEELGCACLWMVGSRLSGATMAYGTHFMCACMYRVRCSSCTETVQTAVASTQSQSVAEAGS
eukprot:5660469-Prymnesium_polylepis.1